jgi:hypothetical protein
MPRARSSTAPPASPAPPLRARPERALAPEARRVSPVEQLRGAEMADALAEAVERLRARAEAAALEDAEAGEAPARAQAPGAQAAQPAHKHSMSLLARLRMWRKQRRKG